VAPLRIAAKYGQAKAVQMLLAKGADANAKTKVRAALSMSPTGLTLVELTPPVLYPIGIHVPTV